MSRTPFRLRRCLPALLIHLAAVSAFPQTRTGSTGPLGGDARLRHRLLVAEDARAPNDEDLALLGQALSHPSPALQRIAVRAIGRLERPALIAEIAPLVGAANPLVRAEAANALAQSLMALTAPGSSGDLASRVAAMLIGQLDRETNPEAAASMLQALGWLPFESATDIETVERRLTSILAPASTSPAMARYGAARGFEALSRLRRRSTPLPADAVAALKAAVFESPRARTATGIQTRRLALAALTSGNAIDRATIEAALTDPDDQVRRLAAVAAGAAESLDGRADLVRAALRDRAPMVRYDALRAWGRRLQASDCGPIRIAAADTNPHVALAALDLLGEPCLAAQASIALLAASVGSNPWHRAAHGYVSLARVSKERAEALLPGFASNPTWQVRMYAARAAGFLGSSPTLERLASDANDNVREAAVAALQNVSAHNADDIYLGALSRSDYQLIQTAADALEGSPRRREAVAALLASLNRLTAERRDTSRDPRMAILKRIRELGLVDDTPALEGCVADFDPNVAAECASILTAWNGRPYAAKAAPVRPAAVPSDAELARMGASRARVSMRGIGIFELRLFADEAPMTVDRFVRLARSGYYNGLTFHRVVPNFVIQGGSPGANEFMGDGDYLRDEVGTRSHTRGTLGISTRGRDCGDAQIFVNLVDNPRLDHIFTVFADVTQGMDVVDRILEGDVIDRLEIVDIGSTKHVARSTRQ